MDKMSSIERVLTTLGQKEPDRVPKFLLLTMHGAKELNISIKDYYSKSSNVIKGQQIVQKKYDNDCYYPFFYAAIETEAYGGEVIYVDDGPPNAGEPIIKNFDDISKMKIPDIKNTPCLIKVLETINTLNKDAKGEIPVIGVALSPFSAPIIQMGFEKYLELLYYKPKQFNELMELNKQFCIDWSNEQLKAGATAICYFDPLASPTIIEKETYLKTGFKIAKQVIPNINGPTATHLASGITIPVIEQLVETKTLIVGVSSKEDLKEVKKKADKRLTILGNLDGISMRNWTETEAELQVKQIIKAGAKGGGFIISDNHGEIPWQVKDNTILAISNAVNEWGKYPIKW